MNKVVKVTPMHARALRNPKPVQLPKPKVPVQPTSLLAKVLAENGEK